MSEFAGGESVNENNTSSTVSSSGYLVKNRSSSRSVEVSLNDYPMSNDNLSSYNSSFAAIRVFYNPDYDPYSPYVSLRCFIVDIGDSKVFVGAFDTDTGDVVPVIQIPLVGQTIDALVVQIQEIPGISAQILNSRGFMSTVKLLTSSHINSTNVWAYFFVNTDSSYSLPESDLKSNIKTYFTSVEPVIEQNNPSQSIGGYISPTEVFDTSALLHSVSFYDQVVKINTTGLTSYSYIQINDEIMEVDRWNGNVAYIKTRQALNTPIRFHPQGSLVMGIISNEIFDVMLSVHKKQYRCFVIKNTSSNEIAYDLKVFFKLKSRNVLSQTRMCIEIPRSEYVSGVANNGSYNSIIGSDFANRYVEDYFVDSSIVIDSGNNANQTRIVKKYIADTGEILLDSDFSYPIVNGDLFHINTSPAQRVKSGFVSPITGDEAIKNNRLVSDFETYVFFDNAIGININNSRLSGSNLNPNECIYVWIERDIFDTNEDFLDNRSILALSYSRV